MFQRHKSEIVCDADGLARLIRDVHNGEQGLITHSMSVTVNVYAQSSGNFLVRLNAHQTQNLRKVVSTYEFSDVYGPRVGDRTNES